MSNYPPGVTEADINAAFGDNPEQQCERCEQSFEPDEPEQKLCEHCLNHTPCCDVPVNADFPDNCPQCKESTL